MVLLGCCSIAGRIAAGGRRCACRPQRPPPWWREHRLPTGQRSTHADPTGAGRCVPRRRLRQLCWTAGPRCSPCCRFCLWPASGWRRKHLCRAAAACQPVWGRCWQPVRHRSSSTSCHAHRYWHIRRPAAGAGAAVLRSAAAGVRPGANSHIRPAGAAVRHCCRCPAGGGIRPAGRHGQLLGGTGCTGLGWRLPRSPAAAIRWAGSRCASAAVQWGAHYPAGLRSAGCTGARVLVGAGSSARWLRQCAAHQSVRQSGALQRSRRSTLCVRCAQAGGSTGRLRRLWRLAAGPLRGAVWPWAAPGPAAAELRRHTTAARWAGRRPLWTGRWVSALWRCSAVWQAWLCAEWPSARAGLLGWAAQA